MQQFALPGVVDGNSDPSKKDTPIYVGMESHLSRIEEEKTENQKKKGDVVEGYKKEKQNKKMRTLEDGLLLVVSTRIHGKTIRALIYSGATRCFATLACITTVGLKGIPRDIFLELGNGEKILSRGYVPDVPMVTAGLTVKVGLIVTNLLHEVDLVLGINWLQLVNPVVDWSSGKIYLPNAVHTALLQGDWLAGHVKAGTVTMLAGGRELEQINDAEERRQISI